MEENVVACAFQVRSSLADDAIQYFKQLSPSMQQCTVEMMVSHPTRSCTKTSNIALLNSIAMQYTTTQIINEIEYVGSVKKRLQLLENALGGDATAVNYQSLDDTEQFLGAALDLSKHLK